MICDFTHEVSSVVFMLVVYMTSKVYMEKLVLLRLILIELGYSRELVERGSISSIVCHAFIGWHQPGWESKDGRSALMGRMGVQLTKRWRSLGLDQQGAQVHTHCHR